MKKTFLIVLSVSASKKSYVTRLALYESSKLLIANFLFLFKMCKVFLVERMSVQESH